MIQSRTPKGSPPSSKNASNQTQSPLPTRSPAVEARLQGDMICATKRHVTATETIVGIKNSRNSVCGWK